MIKMPELSNGFTYTRLPYDEYLETLNVLSDNGWIKEDLGYCSDGVNKVYGFSFGDVVNKPVIFLEGALHGSEWQSAYWLREFMEYISHKSSVHNEAINRIRAKFSFYVIPCLNPWGYINLRRGNANLVDLNRNFDYKHEEQEGPYYDGTNKGPFAESEVETQMLRDKILQLKPFIYIDNHTHGYKRLDAYIHPGLASEFHKLQQDAMESMRFLGAPTAYVTPVADQERPSAVAWVSKQDSKHGTRIISQMPEVGVGIQHDDLAEEYCNEQQARMGINMMMLFCLYVESYFETRKLILK